MNEDHKSLINCKKLILEIKIIRDTNTGYLFNFQDRSFNLNIGDLI